MSAYPDDIYTEPANQDGDTLKNLGPLAGIWTGERGLDVKPKADGPKKQAFVERIELQPIDPVTNGPQLLYGLALSHLHRQAGTDQALSRPGRILAVRAGDQYRDPDARHPARSDRHGRWSGQR